MDKKGKLITFEGIDGSGKTTQIKVLSDFLREKQIAHVCTREPGGTPAGDRIRDLLISSRHNLCREAELLLIEASRVQLIKEIILPELEGGKWVLLDRYSDATIAYQAFGRGIDLGICETLNNFSTSMLEPDLTFLIRIDPDEGLRRKRKQSPGSDDRFEKEDYGFYRRVVEGYDYISGKYGTRVIEVDGKASSREISRIIQCHVTSFFGDEHGNFQ